MHERFYAGAPLTTRDGLNLGVLCVIDTEPRTFSEAESATLTQLAAVVMAAVEARTNEQRLRREVAVHEQTALALRTVESRYRRIAENTPGVVYQFVRHADGRGEFLSVSDACREILGLEAGKRYCATPASTSGSCTRRMPRPRECLARIQGYLEAAALGGASDVSRRPGQVHPIQLPAQADAQRRRVLGRSPDRHHRASAGRGSAAHPRKFHRARQRRFHPEPKAGRSTSRGRGSFTPTRPSRK